MVLIVSLTSMDLQNVQQKENIAINVHKIILKMNQIRADLWIK